MLRTRWFLAALLMVAAIPLLEGTSGASPPSEAPEPTILRIQVTGSGGTAEGTAFLIHQARREHDVVLYFLTAAHLLKPESLGERRVASLRIRLTAGVSTVIDASGSDAVFPGGTDYGLDVAVVKTTSTNTTLTPVAVSAGSPAPGDVFLVKDVQGDSLTVLPERVRFRSTRLVIGDRTAAEVSGLMGAQAMGEHGVFGLVSECSSTRVPIITLLGAARGFLARAIPGWTPQTATTTAFSLEQRAFSGPLLDVPCDAIRAGDLDVPISLTSSEIPVDAIASFSKSSSLRLGDITVMSLEDRSVKLRFTMMGVHPPAFAAPSCPHGQALVTIGVNVVVLPKVNDRMTDPTRGRHP